jgi:hypothetical protein
MMCEVARFLFRMLCAVGMIQIVVCYAIRTILKLKYLIKRENKKHTSSNPHLFFNNRVLND